MSKTITGFSENTSKNLMIDAGAFFINFDIETDTIETAKEKLLGATSGGGEFSAVPKFREIKADGVKGKAKGLQALEAWEVTMKANLLEFKEETFKRALASSNVSDITVGEKKYRKIEGKNYIEDTDYISNITYMGNLSGSNEPVIIQVFNAINTEGLKIKPKDGDDIICELEFEGTYDTNNLDNPPFAIYYPTQTIVGA